MKRLLTIFLLLICPVLCFAQNSGTDAQLYNEVRQNFENGFYPGVVTSTEQLQKKFPESSLIPSALACKGEAYIFMDSYDDAIETLNSAVLHMHSGSPEIIRCNYLLGRALYHQKKYSSALEKFHLACSLCYTNHDMELYAPSIFNSGRAFYELGKIKDASKHFEYVVSNGKLFETADYEEAVQKLFICYNKTGTPEKTAALFNKLSEDDFDSEVYLTLCFYYGDACVALKKNKEAYDAYTRAIKGGDKHPDRVNSFLIRFAIDEFNAKNYDKADGYLSDIEIPEEGDYSDLRLVKTLYQAKILLEKGQPSDAEKKLSGLESLAKKSEIDRAADSYYSTLLQCKIQNEKWDEIPGVYSKLKNPDASDKQAISSYYYKKGQFDKVAPESGELYASALCKLGRYSEACEQYAKLNSVSFDYALALFRTGRYAESEKIADKSGVPQKDYLAGLCLLNQKSWKKAAERFAAYIRVCSGNSDFNKLAHYYKGYSEYNLAEFKNSYSSFVRYCMEENVPSSPNSPSGSTQLSYVLRAYEYAVKSALQSGDFKNASLQAANLVKFSPNGEQKQKAVVLSADIFTDYKNYDAAIQLLEPYTGGRDDFAAQALFMTAKIYERQGNVQKADEVFRRTYENHPRSVFAEEAMYRAGEVYYTGGDYAQAYSRFNSYVYKYASGVSAMLRCFIVQTARSGLEKTTVALC